MGHIHGDMTRISIVLPRPSAFFPPIRCQSDDRRRILRDLARDLTEEQLAQPDRIIQTRPGNTPPPPPDDVPPSTGGYLPAGVPAIVHPDEFVLGRDMFT